MTSQEIQELLSRLRDSELPGESAEAKGLQELLASDSEAQAFDAYMTQTQGLFSQHAEEIAVPPIDGTLAFLRTERANTDATDTAEQAAPQVGKPAGKRIAFPIGLGLGLAAAAAALLAILFLPDATGTTAPAGDMYAASSAIESIESDLPNAVISVYTAPETSIPVIWISEMNDLEGVEL